jgi:hypothetical protein
MTKEKEFFFFIADISGYTSFMLTNKFAIEHAKLTINEILKTLIKYSELPIEISKLEGDAIFFYLEPIRDTQWLSQKLFQFFAAFNEKVKELQESSTCRCGACKNINSLKLKIIVHYGLASLENFYQFKELSGLDVIVVHRLLKNHVPQKRYLLLTEAAYQHMQLPEHLSLEKGKEIYADIGEVSIYVCDPPYILEGKQENYRTLFYMMKRFMNMVINQSLLKLGLKKMGIFHNIP